MAERTLQHFFGTLDLVFDSTEEVYVTLMNMAYVPGISSNLFSLHAVSVQETVAMNSSCTHVMGGCLFFPRGATGADVIVTKKRLYVKVAAVTPIAVAPEVARAHTSTSTTAIARGPVLTQLPSLAVAVLRPGKIPVKKVRLVLTISMLRITTPTLILCVKRRINYSRCSIKGEVEAVFGMF